MRSPTYEHRTVKYLSGVFEFFTATRPVASLKSVRAPNPTPKKPALLS